MADTVKYIEIGGVRKPIEDATARAMAGGAVPLDNGIVGINTGAIYTGGVGDGIIKINIPTQGFSGTFNLELQGVFLESIYHTFDLRIGVNSLIDNTFGFVSALLIANTKAISKVAAGYDSANNNLCILVYSATNRFRYLQANIGRITLRESAGNRLKLSDWSTEYIADTNGITNVVETPVSWVATDDGVWYDMSLNAPAGVTGQVQYRKIGNEVIIQGNIVVNNPSTVNIFFMPAGYRPKKDIVLRLFGDTTTSLYEKTLIIFSDGRFTVSHASGVSNTLSINIRYIADA